MKLSIMIEGALGLNWERWQRLVRAAEELGFSGIYRSDHFMGRPGQREDALEPLVSLAWAAANTTRIQFGTLVSPISFRDPRILAWQATAINDLAGGRLRLGLGAGWQEQEHTAFGFDLQPIGERFARMQEGVEVYLALTRSDQPVSYNGEYFQLREAQLLPRHQEQNSPALIIGGSGPKRTLPLAAKYADVWNALMGSNEEFRERNTMLDEMLDAQGRERSSVERTQMIRCIIAADQATLDAHPDVDRFDEIRARGGIIGTPATLVDAISAKAEVGVQELMLQWLELDNIAGLELLARDVLPQVQH